MEGEKEYLKAGKIAKQVMDLAIRKVKPGAKLLDLANFADKKIEELGGKPAFPINISINEVAAHYTPSFDEERVFEESDLVKLDLGVHIEGYISDTARTVDLSGRYTELTEASKKALENALSVIKAGVNTNKIGQVIEETIRNSGFRPIENLTGHVLSQYQLHGVFAVPNIKTAHSYRLEEGMAVAIEPFATTGIGRVGESNRTDIFRVRQRRPLRSREARKIFEFAAENYKTLPFAERWISPLASGLKFKMALRELVLQEAFMTYPMLTEAEKGMVSQREDSVIVERDGCNVYTK